MFIAACASFTLLHCHLEIPPGDEAHREISAVCRSLLVSRGGLLGINCIQSDMSLLAGSTFTCHITPAGGLETYCPQDSVIMQEGLYYSGVSCIALMSQYVCCNSMPDEVYLPGVAAFYRPLKSTLLLLSEPAHLSAKLF